MSKKREKQNKKSSMNVRPKTVPKRRVNEKRLRMWQRLAMFAGVLIVICLIALLAMGEL